MKNPAAKGIYRALSWAGVYFAQGLPDADAERESDAVAGAEEHPRQATKPGNNGIIGPDMGQRDASLRRSQTALVSKWYWRYKGNPQTETRSAKVLFSSACAWREALRALMQSSFEIAFGDICVNQKDLRL